MTHARLITCIAIGLLTLSGILSLVPAKTAIAQSAPMPIQSRFDMRDPGDLGITVAQYDPDAHPAFADLLQSPNWSRVAPYTAVITNRSARPIEALLVQWTVVNGSGASETNNLQADSYFKRFRRSIIPAGMQAIVTPSGYLRADEVKASITSAVPGPTVLDELDRAVHILMNVDSVIFDDGLVAGPDTFQIAEFLASRQSAAKKLVAQVRVARGNKKAVAALLSDLTISCDGDLSTNRSAFWTYQFADMVKHSPSMLEYLASLPDLPKFVR